MRNYRIVRTGQAPLVFQGRQVAESDGATAAGKEQNRWHELRIYQTAGGNYVAEIAYHTQWQGELGYVEADEIELAGLAEYFASYDPTAHIQGFPSNPQYADRQAHLLTWVRRRYEEQVGEMLSQIEGVEDRVE